MRLGFDFGSQNVHFAALSDDKVVRKTSVPHNGNVFGTVKGLVEATVEEFGLEAIERYGVTGNLSLDGIRGIDPILASIEANKFLRTGCHNILSIGCESFYLILLNDRFGYMEHSVNTDCAAGTGSFIDQQAKRLEYSIADFAREADRFAGKSATIATRCAVFAKSDIIHAQAEGFAKGAIAAGICEGVVRSVGANVIQGRSLDGGVVLTGGVSLNQKIASEFSLTLGQEVVVPPEGVVFNAIGAALLGEETELGKLCEGWGFRGTRETREKLAIRLTEYPDFAADRNYKKEGIEVTLYDALAADTFDTYLGVDVGSTSTKLILMDDEQNVLAGLYTRTAGAPIDAVSHLLKELKVIFGEKDLNIKGVGVTGSGRLLIREIIGADLAINEITAHARGATFLDPEVDTIIEIGGQDSKFTLLKNGFVGHSVMNYVCAAGTGSFIEEQAKKLNIELDDISELALGRKAPLTSDRCTVYMERDLNLLLAEGWSREEVIASVLYSVRDNYLAKVAGRALFGKKVYFQGATAKNKALVAAFENEIGRPIAVSKFCHLTGALGSALSVKDALRKDSTFRGVDFEYSSGTDLCELCANNCHLNVYTVDDARVAWGMKCGRDYDDDKAGSLNPLSRLEKSWRKTFKAAPPAPKEGAPTIGIPNCLSMEEYSPVFQELFTRLGMNVVIENNSPAKMDHGRKLACADFCSPILIAHGLVHALVEKKVDYIFFPALINEQSYLDKLPAEEDFLAKDRDCYLCYYTQYASTLVDNLLTLDVSGKMISPKIKFNQQQIETVAETVAASLKVVCGVDVGTIAHTFLDVFREYEQRKQQWQARGREMIASEPGTMKLLLLGRPYVVFDRTINSGIPATLEGLGYDLIHQSMLDLGRRPPTASSRHADRMHWYYGQQILLAAETAVEQDNIYPVFLSNFRCSPDAYLVTYFKEMMEEANKPYLIIQLDEHHSDVGYQTRIEAGIDSFRNDFAARAHRQGSASSLAETLPNFEENVTREDTIYFPYLSPVLDTLIYASYAAHGYTAKALSLDQKIINLGYKYVSGGECLPNVAVAGSVIDKFQKGEFDPKRSVLNLADSCLSCNFHQYASLIKAACRRAGMEDLRIYSPKLGMPRPILPDGLVLDMTASCVLGSLLYKLYFRFHPYEKRAGATQEALEQSIAIIKNALQKKIPLWEIPLQKLGARLGKAYIQKLIDKDLAGGIDAISEKDFEPEQKSSPAVMDRVKEFLHPSKYMLQAAGEIRALFEGIEIEGERRPRIGLLGDLYVKYNTILNEDIYSLIEELGGEILLPSYMETGAHLMDASVRESNASKEKLIKVTIYEQSFEHVFRGMLDDSFEPPVEECVALMHEYGLEHFIPGETTINVGRFLYYAKHNLVDAVIHINPILCCPGSVTTSIFRKLQKDFNLPIVNVFYDGINKPNKGIIPQMHHLVHAD